MKSLVKICLVLGLVAILADSAFAAPKKFRWGALNPDSTPGISFRRQANNISEFKAFVPIRCVHSDATESDVLYYISGEEVPNLLVVSRNVHGEFHDDEGSLGLSAEVSVDINFRSKKRASADIIVVTDPDPETSCTGSISYETIKRGTQVRE
jgi:hypothetical protein